MKTYKLGPSDPAIGQIDGVTSRKLEEGDMVVACSNRHIWLKESWDYNGGVCPYCDKRKAPPLKNPAITAPDQDDALPSGEYDHTPNPTLPVLLGIGLIASVAICLIIVVTSLTKQNTADPIPVVETVIVEVSSESEPEALVLTSTPRPVQIAQSSAEQPTNTPRSSSSASPSSDQRNIPSIRCSGARGPSFAIGDRFVVPFGDGATGVFKYPNKVPKVATMLEGSGGKIIGGPECVRGQEGNLIAWKVRTDAGDTGWVAEGYDHSPVPWIEPEN